MTDISIGNEVGGSALDAEALKPVDLLGALNAAAGMPNDATAAPRRRGRPPGSKNRSTIAREQQTGVRSGPQRLVTPPIRTPLTPSEEEAKRVEEAARRIHKAERVEELTAKIGEAVNENIALLLTSAGVPARFIYTPGNEPAQTQTDSKYTPLAHKVLFTAHQTRNYAKFIAELEETDLGKKATGVTGNSNTSLLIYGLLSLGSTIQYLQGVSEFNKTLRPMLEQYKAWQMQQASDMQNASASNGAPQNVGG